MFMLELLSKNDAIWRRNALSICRDKDLADDLVQEMYLTLLKRNPDISKINNQYVNRTLINLYKDYLKEKKLITVSVDECYNIANEEEEVDVFCDKDLSILNKAESLDDYDKNLLVGVYDSSIRQLAESLDVSYMKVYRNLEASRRSVLEDDYDKEYKNRRCKYKKIV